MKSKLILLVLVVLMAGSFTTAAVALAKTDDDGNDGGKDDRAAHGTKHPGHSKAKGKDRGFGPPPWAGNPMDGGGPGGRGPHGHPFKNWDKKFDKDWLKEWKSLTPAQRAERMAQLAREHAEAIEKWAACVKAAGEDRAKRAECERPVPPGLAKKRPRP